LILSNKYLTLNQISQNLKGETMSAVSIWILSIIGVVIMSVVVDLVMPNGSTSKFIKNIFAFVIIIVIISPIVSFLSNKNFNLEDFFSGTSITVQEDFISSVNKQLIDKMEEDILKTLKANGINQVQVGISADIFKKKLEVEQVSVDLTQIVIDENFSHIDIKTSIRKIVLRFVSVKESNIIFYE